MKRENLRAELEKLKNWSAELRRKLLEKGEKSSLNLLNRSDEILKEAETLLLGKVSNKELETIDLKLRVASDTLQRAAGGNSNFWIDVLKLIPILIGIKFVVHTFLFSLQEVPTGSAEPTLLVGDRVVVDRISKWIGWTPSRGDLVLFDEQTFKYDSKSWLRRIWQKYFGLDLFGILPAGPRNVLKRVIALPGDTIAGRIENGKACVYLNGKKLYEPYVNRFPLILIKRRIGALSALLLKGVEEEKDNGRYIPVYVTYDPSRPYEDQPFYKFSAKDVLPAPESPSLIEPFLPSEHPLRDRYGNLVAVEDKDVFGPIKVPEGKYWVMGDNRKNSNDSRFWGFLDGKRIRGKVVLILYSIDSINPLGILQLFIHPIDFFRKMLRRDRLMVKPRPYNFDSSKGARPYPCLPDNDSDKKIAEGRRQD